MIATVAPFPTHSVPFTNLPDVVLSQYSSLNFGITIFNFNSFLFVIIKQLVYIVVWIKTMRFLLYSSLTSTLYKSITTMDSNDTMDDSGQNLMHQTNDKIYIGENAKVTQHYSYF